MEKLTSEKITVVIFQKFSLQKKDGKYFGKNE